jgi:hypothetical protein
VVVGTCAALCGPVVGTCAWALARPVIDGTPSRAAAMATATSARRKGEREFVEFDTRLLITVRKTGQTEASRS